jgi:hypothetical protein
MKRIAFLLGIVLLLAGSAAAQVNSTDSLTSAPTAALPLQPAPLANSQLDLAVSPGVSSTPDLVPSSAPADFGLALPSAPVPGEPADPQGVQGVFQYFNWQAYLGYTFVRFYEVPGTEINSNGLNFGAVYYVKDWLGAEGEFVGTYNWQFGACGKFLMGVGGVRVRHSMQHNIEVWAHALAGGAHYSPQTAYGKEGAFGYLLGGGVDLNTRHRRISYTLSLDAAGTTFFGTYQVSPKISAGVVFKF